MATDTGTATGTGLARPVSKRPGMRRRAAAAALLSCLPLGAALAQGYPSPGPGGPSGIPTRPDNAPVAPSLPGGPPAQPPTEAPRPRPWLSPTITLTETYSDNAFLAPDPLAQRGWITDVAPGLRAENSLNARIHYYLDYRLHQLLYSNNSDANDTQNFLDSLLRLELVEKSVFFDARAEITQGARSAFGTTLAPNLPGVVANRVETQTYRASPYLRGAFSDIARYRLQYEYSNLRADTERESRVATHHVSGQMRNFSGGTRLGWSLDYESIAIVRPDQADADDSRIRASLWMTITPQFQVAVSEGYETHKNLLGEGRRNEDVPGLGLSWRPSERTQLTSIWERRFFGTGSITTFLHRTPRTAWRIAAQRDVTALPSLVTNASGSTLTQLLDDLLTASIPDPQQRADAARARFERSGLTDATPLDTNFVTTRPVLDKSATASVVYTMPRDTLNLLVAYREQRALGESSVVDSFTLSDRIRRSGVSGGYGHNLTSLTTFNIDGSWIKTRGLSASDLESVQRLMSVYVTTRLGPRTTASLGYRHTRFDSTTEADYRENAVFATFSYGL